MTKARTLAGFGLAAAVLAVAPAQAAPILLETIQNPDVQSEFTLDFGDYGGQITANISQTRFDLEIDPDVGSAEFASYVQKIDPLILPGDVSTGNIRVEVAQGSSSGTYDPNTGIFSTTEDYVIYFQGDLSAYGFESPVTLTSDSLGTVVFDGEGDANVALNWAGDYSIGGIPFTYTCTVNTTTTPEPGVALLLLAGTPLAMARRRR